MKTGRPPTSSAEHKSKGTYRADRHGNRLDQKFPAGIPDEPSNLGEVGIRLWRDVVRTFPPEALSTIDWAALEECCRWKDLADRYYQLVDADPLELKCFNAWRDASQKFLSYMSRFGLSPIDRARIKAAPKDDRQDSPMAQLLKLKAAT